MIDLIDKEINIREKLFYSVKNELKNYLYTVSIMLYETIKDNGKVILFGDDEFQDIIENLHRVFLKTFMNLQGVSAIALKNNPDLKEETFQRQIFSCVEKKDMLLCFSIDGNNKALLRGLSLGKNLGCRTVAFSGYNSGVIGDFCDILITLEDSDKEVLGEFYLILGDIITQVTNSSFSTLN